jgi:hypothetical protein
MFAEGSKKWTAVLARVVLEDVHYYQASCWRPWLEHGRTESGSEFRGVEARADMFVD